MLQKPQQYVQIVTWPRMISLWWSPWRKLVKDFGKPVRRLTFWQPRPKSKLEPGTSEPVRKWEDYASSDRDEAIWSQDTKTLWDKVEWKRTDKTGKRRDHNIFRPRKSTHICSWPTHDIRHSKGTPGMGTCLRKNPHSKIKTSFSVMHPPMLQRKTRKKTSMGHCRLPLMGYPEET